MTWYIGEYIFSKEHFVPPYKSKSPEMLSERGRAELSLCQIKNKHNVIGTNVFLEL